MCDKKFVFPAIVKKDTSGYFVFFPDLEGCFSSGENIVDAWLNAREALALCLHGLKDVPKATSIEKIKVGSDETLLLVSPDETVKIESVDASKDVTKILDEALKAKGYTKYKVAKLLGISESYIGRIVAGARTPSPTLAQKLSALLELDWQIFYMQKTN